MCTYLTKSSICIWHFHSQQLCLAGLIDQEREGFAWSFSAFAIDGYFSPCVSDILVEEQSIGPVTLSWEQRFDG